MKCVEIIMVICGDFVFCEFVDDEGFELVSSVHICANFITLVKRVGKFGRASRKIN